MSRLPLQPRAAILSVGYLRRRLSEGTHHANVEADCHRISASTHLIYRSESMYRMNAWLAYHAGVSDAVAKQKERIWALKRDLSTATKERDSLRQQLDQLKGKSLH